MPKFNTWLHRRHGAAMVEKLLVILFASVLVGGAIMVFGPTLAKKYSFAAKMLNMEEEPTRTLADGPARDRSGTNPIWYVVFTFGVIAFFAVFLAPMLFPRARRTRQLILLDLAERFPVLTPLIDPDMRADAKLDELRGLAQEVNELGAHRAGALDIQPHDYGKMALPSEQTVDASFSEMPNLEEILAGETPKSKNAKALRDSGALGAYDESDETQMAIARPTGLQALKGDDGIPFNSVDPSAKPQMQPLKKPKPRPRPVPGDDSTTIDVPNPNELFEDADALAAQILRQSSALPAIEDTDDATIIRDSQPLPSVDDTAVETNLVRPLDRNRVRSGPLADQTTPDDIRKPRGPEATTQDFDSYD